MVYYLWTELCQNDSLGSLWVFPKLMMTLMNGSSSDDQFTEPLKVLCRSKLSSAVSAVMSLVNSVSAILFLFGLLFRKCLLELAVLGVIYCNVTKGIDTFPQVSELKRIEKVQQSIRFIVQESVNGWLHVRFSSLMNK